MLGDFFRAVFFYFKPFEQILNKYNYYPKFINHILPCQTQKTSSWQIIMALKKKRRLFESQKVICKAVFGFELHSFMAISSNSQQNEVDAKKDSVTIKAGEFDDGFLQSAKSEDLFIENHFLHICKPNSRNILAAKMIALRFFFISPAKDVFKLALIQNHIIELQQSPPFPKSSPQADLKFILLNHPLAQISPNLMSEVLQSNLKKWSADPLKYSTYCW